MNQEEKKPCAMCKKVKPLTEFRYWKKGDKYDCYCKDCRRLYDRVDRREYRKAYYKAHRQEIIDRSKEYNKHHNKKVC